MAVIRRRIGGSMNALRSVVSPLDQRADVMDASRRAADESNQYALDTDPSENFGIPHWQASQSAINDMVDPQGIKGVMQLAKERTGTYNSIPGTAFLRNSDLGAPSAAFNPEDLNAPFGATAEDDRIPPPPEVPQYGRVRSRSLQSLKRAVGI